MISTDIISAILISLNDNKKVEFLPNDKGNSFYCIKKGKHPNQIRISHHELKDLEELTDPASYSNISIVFSDVDGTSGSKIIKGKGFEVVQYIYMSSGVTKDDIPLFVDAIIKANSTGEYDDPFNEKKYVIGAHNAWSFLSVRKWWMWPFKFMARCQKANIKEQYMLHDVRCFDLRVYFNKDGELTIRHGMLEYEYDEDRLMKDLEFLNNRSEKCYIRVLHEVRTQKKYTEDAIEMFQMFCERVEKRFPKLKFWCGRNVVNWTVDYEFKNHPTCEEKYSSVCPPNIIDDWIPILYAKINNRNVRRDGTDKDILLMDFVNIY